MMDLLGVSTRINVHLAVIGGVLKGFKDAQAAKRHDRDRPDGIGKQAQKEGSE